MWTIKTLFGNKLVDLEQHNSNRAISMSEVSLHDSSDDCWIVLFNNVYDVTKFFSLHPGGSEVLMENGGRDATISFQEAGHTDVSLSLMESYRIGMLPDHEHLNLDLILGNSWKSASLIA